MKRKSLLAVALVSLLGGGSLVMGGLTSCQPTQDVKTEVYKVTFESSSAYKVEGIKADGYKVGETVEFSVTVLDDTKLLDNVKVGTTKLTEEGGKYSFVMPETNTKITVTLKDKEVPVEHVLAASLSSDPVVGKTATVFVTLDGGPFTGTSTLEVTTGETLVGLTDKEVEFLAEGAVVIKVSATVENKPISYDLSFTVAPAPVVDYDTIAEAKAKALGESVLIKGKVTATSGTSAFVSDATGGIYIYNWYFSKEDTAIVDKSWTLGDVVEVKANVATSPNVGNDNYKQLSNFSGGRIEGTYAYKLEGDVEVKAPTVLDEAGYKALTIADVGNMYTFDATYVSGTPVADKAAEIKFTLGSSSVSLRTDGSGSKMYDKYISELIENFEALKLVAGSNVTITAPLNWYKASQFTYMSKGVTITKKAETPVFPTAIAITASAESVDIGGTVKLETSLTPSNANQGTIGYAITDGADFASLDGNTIIGIAAGTVTAQATVIFDDPTKEPLKSNEVTITVTGEIQGPVTISEAKAKEVGEAVTVKGKVTMISGKSAYIADETAGVYVYNWSPIDTDTAISGGTWTLGQSVEVCAYMAEYNGLIQISNYDSINKARIDGTYATTITEEVSAKAPISLTEETYKKLTAADSGNMYTFDAVYTGGTPATGVASNINFTLGSTAIVLRTDKYDAGLSDLVANFNLVSGNHVTITTALSWFNGAQFAWFTKGTSVTKKEVNATKVVVTTDKETIKINEVATLGATLTPADSSGVVSYAIAEGGDFATLVDNKLTGKAAGVVKVKASIANPDLTVIASEVISITVSSETVTPPKESYTVDLTTDYGISNAYQTFSIPNGETGNLNFTFGDYQEWPAGTGFHHVLGSNSKNVSKAGSVPLAQLKAIDTTATADASKIGDFYFFSMYMDFDVADSNGVNLTGVSNNAATGTRYLLQSLDKGATYTIVKEEALDDSTAGSMEYTSNEAVTARYAVVFKSNYGKGPRYPLNSFAVTTK